MLNIMSKIIFVVIAVTVVSLGSSKIAEAGYPHQKHVSNYGRSYSHNVAVHHHVHVVQAPRIVRYAPMPAAIPAQIIPEPVYHNTTHWDWVPAQYVVHNGHYHLVQGHYELHRTGHWHY